MSTGGGAGKIETQQMGQMKPFDLRAIEKELRDLWKEKPEESGKQTTTRACVANLIIYEEGEASALAETIIDVTKHHPSRVVVMSTRPNSLHDGIEAEVSAVCHFAPGRGKQVCSEQILLSAQGEAVKRLASTVMPLLVSDLPVSVWWRGVPIDAQPFKGLLHTADRMILDSNYSRRPTAFLSVLAAMVRERRYCAFSDLNWSRLTQLRSHIAGLFDVPDLRRFLKDISKVLIEYPAASADQDLPAPQAMLLLGWFVDRLDWDGDNAEVFQAKSGAHIIKLKSGARDITVDMVPGEGLDAQDLRITLTMTDDTGWQEARMLITRAYTRNAIETKLETPTICWLKDVAKYEMPQEAELISRELEIVGHDPVYEGALYCAGLIVEKM